MSIKYNKRHCEQCSTTYLPKHKTSRFCQISCYWKSLEGKPNRRNGGKIKRGGYWYIYSPDHLKVGKQGYYAEHRLVMEKKLGRYLTAREVVHHKDENKENNKIDNLVLCSSRGQHTKLFHPEAMIKATAASALKPNTEKQLEALKLGRKYWPRKKLINS